VWQKSFAFVMDVYEILKKFPDNEKYVLSYQIRKAVVSIPSNIAEGYGRRSSKDYVRFLNIAMGSLFELQTLMLLSKNLNFIDKNNYLKLDMKFVEIERMLSSLITKLKLYINKK
jgi:four helix bundle protein